MNRLINIRPLKMWDRLLAAWCWFAICCAAAAVASRVCHAEDGSAFASVEDRTFRAEFDQSDQKYVVMTPKGFAPAQPVSLLIALHGHGSDRWQFVRQPRGECRATRDVAAAKKMILVSPDYRSKTSWMGPAAEADMVQIIRSLKKRHKVRQVILCGGSMGGTGALAFTALHPDVIDGVVSLNGTANLVDYTRFQDAITKSFGGSKQQVPAEYKKRSAEFYPKRFAMPFAATTGGRDEVVPAESVLRLMDQVRKHNVDVLSIHQPDGGHSTSYDDTRRALEFVIVASEKRSASSNNTAPGTKRKAVSPKN
jgi:predicted esterase